MEREPLAIAMGLLRALSGSAELLVGLLILYWGRVETGLRLNAYMALVGPLVLLTVTALGTIGLLGKGMSATNLLLILLGVALILYATR
ncbi:MAG: DUF2619 domain-containing protein [Bacillota bacterium]|nr:DUF2619 domain-containing protein [Bacillota bacterium]